MSEKGDPMKMMPGQTPYTPEQERKLNSMLGDACAATEQFDEDDLERHADRLRESEKIALACERLSRERCVELLNEACIQCYDYEPVGLLREAVRVNVLDGTIARSRTWTP